MSATETVAIATLKQATLTERSAIQRFLALTVIVALASFVFGGVYVEQMLARGFRPGSMGVAFFLAFAVGTVVEVISGDWADRYGHRRMTVVGLLLWGAGLITFDYVTSVGELVLCLACWSLGQAIYSGAPVSLTINIISADRPAVRHAVVRAGQIARWAGAALGGLLVWLGVRPAGVTNLVVGAGAALILAAAYVRLRWPEHAPGASHRDGGLVSRVRALWSPELTSLFAVCVMSTAQLSLFLFAWQPTATSVLHLATRGLGAVLVGLTAVAALGSWAVKNTQPALSRKNLDLWLLTVVGGALLGAMALGPIPAVAGYIGVELTTAYVVTAAAGRAHALFADSARNLLWSVFTAGMGAAMSLADLAFGLLWERVSLATALGWSVGVAAMLCAMTWVGMRWVRPGASPRWWPASRA